MVATTIVLVVAACGGDDDDTDATADPATCAARADADAAVDELAAIDVAASDPAQLAASVDDVEAAVSEVAAAAGADDTDILAQIDDTIAELPADPDLDDQLTLNGVRDVRDIIVADVRAWLNDVAPGCS
jgi:hypothetical protein